MYLFLFFTALILETASAANKPFEFPADTFAFSNETYYLYKTSQNGDVEIQRRPDGAIPDFSRHCFVLTRGVMQFYKFGVFRPELPKDSEADYRTIIRRLSRIPAWSNRREKIIIPGYKDLYEFSEDRRSLLQKELGRWWPPCFRLGNWRIVMPVFRSGQRSLAFWLKHELDKGTVRAVYITRFRPINHCLLAYYYSAKPNGDLLFYVYDSNQAGKVVHLRYRAKDESFYFDRTWYYPGGLITVLKLYVSPLM
ncbi:MAG: hypothetical protein JOY96_05750 [Verrucomicrobia bacterium]|nr:hypothetical protein [Verrucomicrobiota bacterium]